MRKIELTDLELRLLKLDVIHEFSDFDATEEELRAMVSVINKADDLMRELDEYDELGTDLILWFWEKYLKQEKGVDFIDKKIRQQIDSSDLRIDDLTQDELDDLKGEILYVEAGGELLDGILCGVERRKNIERLNQILNDIETLEKWYLRQINQANSQKKEPRRALFYLYKNRLIEFFGVRSKSSARISKSATCA